MQTQQTIKQAVDVLAFGNVIATLVGWLPHIAAALSVVWLLMQITEKATGKPISVLVRCLWDRIRGKVVDKIKTPW